MPGQVIIIIMCKISENTRRFSVVQQTSLLERLQLNCSYLGKVDKFSKLWFHLDSCIVPDQSPSLKRVHQPRSNKTSREWENNLQIWSYSQVSRVVTRRFAGVASDVVKLNWLPVNKNLKLNILKLTHKSLYDETFPEYLKLNFRRSVLIA